MTSILLGLRILACMMLMVPSFSLRFSGFLRNRNLVHREQSKLQLSAHHKVTIIHEGKETIHEVEEDTSVLTVALEAGIELPHDCTLGVCLTCPMRIVSGEVDQTGGTLDDSVIADGFALSCCSYPRSDVVIRSIDEKELVDAQFSDRT
jgi:2Fe-2S type ferredoxin